MYRTFFKLIVSILTAGLLAVLCVRSITGAGYQNMGNLNLLWAVEEDSQVQEKLERAERYLKQAVFFDPDKLNHSRSLGEVRFFKLDYPEAQSAFLVSSADQHLRTFQLAWLFSTGVQVLHQKSYDEAIGVKNIMGRITSIYPEDAVLTCKSQQVSIGLGQAWSFGHEGDPKAQEIVYQMVIALAPGCPAAYYDLGNLRSSQQRYDEAIVAFQQGIAVDLKTTACGYEYIAGAYMEQGRLDEVAEAAEAAIRHGGGSQATMLLGRVYQLRGDLPHARDQYLTATQQTSPCEHDDWSRWRAFFYLGWMAFDRTEYDLAISYIMQASSVMPGTAAEPQALKFAGDMYRQRGMLPEAIQIYEQAARLAPAGWDWVKNIHLALADAYRDAGQTASAIQEYSRALQRTPNDSYIEAELSKLQSINK